MPKEAAIHPVSFLRSPAAEGSISDERLIKAVYWKLASVAAQEA